MPKVPARRGVLARGGLAWRLMGRLMGRIVLTNLAGISVAVVAPSPSVAQQPEPSSIRVSPTIVAAAGSEAILAIEVEPLDAGSSRSFVSLRGLPPAVSLPDGHAVGPGSWAVPLSALPLLKAQIPAAQSSRSEIVISLIAMDGRLLAQARSTLVVEPSAQAGAGVASSVAPVPAGGQVAAAPLAAPEPTAEERMRAERLLARGQAYLANGNIMVARDFFERAADAGLAASALLLATTYDPVELTRLRAQGVRPDVGLARKWYKRAHDLGAAEAAEPLTRLGQN